MNIDLIKKLVKIQSTSYNTYRMFSFIIRQLKVMDVEYFVNDGNIYVTKGEGLNGYPCVVSHTDTVHEICPNKVECLEVKGNLIAVNTGRMEQVGTGGDDKNGIYVCLEILAHCADVKAVFFRDEETGCNGSYNALTTFFNDVNFVLQCDRKGNSDFVVNAASTELSGKQFQNDIKGLVSKYGYSFYKYGGLTDVVALKELGINVCMSNISCGYYNPHSSTEYINLRDLDTAFKLVHSIIHKFGKVYYKHKTKSKRYTPTVWDYTWDYKQFKGVKKDSNLLTEECESCGGNSNKVTYSTNFNMLLCNSCNDYYK